MIEYVIAWAEGKASLRTSLMVFEMLMNWRGDWNQVGELSSDNCGFCFFFCLPKPTESEFY